MPVLFLTADWPGTTVMQTKHLPVLFLTADWPSTTVMQTKHLPVLFLKQWSVRLEV